jgi:hypothetical protein
LNSVCYFVPSTCNICDCKQFDSIYFHIKFSSTSDVQILQILVQTTV